MFDERPQPYIGVSGIAHYEQHLALFDIAMREHLDQLGHFMMIGVQATGKTQVEEVENRRGPNWHPVGDAISDAAANEDSGLTKPYVHVFFKDEEIVRGITNVMRRTLHYSRGVQFNGLPWTDTDYKDMLTDFSEYYPNQSVILQASNQVLENSTPKQLTNELARLPVNHVLLDPSGGYGRKFDQAKLRQYVDEIYQQQLPVGVGVAGGLDAKSVEELFGPLVEEYPGLSCDAEGRLRKGKEGSTSLDLEKTEAYILAWQGVIKASSSIRSTAR
jgi:hypothetical protein